MNSTTGLAQSFSNSQPVFQYIYIFGILFYKNGSVFKEKSVSVDDESDKRRILKKVFSNHNIDGIHEVSRKIIKRSPTSQIEKEKMKENKRSLMIIRKFQQEGLSSMNEDWLRALRLILEDIYNNLFETLKNKQNKPIDLWFSHTINNPSIVNFLASLKGKDFYFNDITLLTRVHPRKINFKNLPSSSSKTEVRYHMKFNSRYGLVDLASFHRSFRQQYIVFPEVDFSVKDTQFFNGKDILIMELEEKPKSKKEWIKIREMVQTVLLSEYGNDVDSERAKCIQKAVFVVSLRLPMKRIHESAIILKQFILKIDHSARDVPTYDMLAKDIDTSNTNEIQEKYDAYRIPFNYVVDNVLYKRKRNILPSLERATQIINEIFGGNYMQEDIEPLWEKCKETADTHELTIIEYSSLHPLTQTLVNNDASLLDRKEISLLKLAIRQCDGKWMGNPITLYSFDSMKSASLNALTRLSIGGTVEINIKKELYLTVEDAWENRLQEESSFEYVMYQIDVQDDTALLNLTHLLQMPKASYHLSTNTFVKKYKMFRKKIRNLNVKVIKLIPKEELKETLLVSLVKNLNLIFSKYNKECFMSSLLYRKNILQ